MLLASPERGKTPLLNTDFLSGHQEGHWCQKDRIPCLFPAWYRKTGLKEFRVRTVVPGCDIFGIFLGQAHYRTGILLGSSEKAEIIFTEGVHPEIPSFSWK